MSSKTDQYNSLKNKVIFGKYKTTKIIGKGSFGGVFQGVNTKTKKPVAIKFEARNADSHLLKIECSFLSFLKGFGIPKLLGYGRYFNYNVMIQEILGFNLMQIKNIITKFTIKDIAMMGIQMMDRIEFIHSRYILHRDIKPENFTVGYDDITNIYLIDFGISRKYRSSRTLKHVKYALIGRMFGTVRYASYNASRGVEQSRRDDLESIGNMLIYIYTGKLPWKGISLKDKQRKKKYLEMLLLKKYTPIETICKNMPKEFIEYYKYCRKLNFEQEPDYEYLRNIFRSILSSLHELYDYKFSWLFNKSYLHKIKEYNPKINLKNINIAGGKIISKRKSPSTKLYNKIKYSLEKNESERYKRSVGQSEYLAPQDNNININNIIDLESIKTYNRGRSEDAVKLKERNDINENQNNLDKNKSDLTYKSVFAQYNMNVDEFQDETKIYEQNKSIINKIKNSKNDNLNEMNINLSDLQSYNVHSENKSLKNIFNISLILKDFKKNNNTKYKLNLSLDLGINYIKGNSDNINNAELKRTKSQETKNNLIKKNSLTNQEKQIQNKQKELYKIIMDKIMKKKPPKINKKKIDTNKKEVKKEVYISKHVKTKTGINIKNEVNSDNFSFKDYYTGKTNVNNLSRRGNGQNQRHISKNNNMKNNQSNNIKRINPSSIVKNNNNIYVNKNNNKTKNIIENNINADKGIKIIINTNFNNLSKPSQKIPSKNFYIAPNNATMPFPENIKMNPIKNMHKNSTNAINNSQVKQFINNNFMKKNNNNQNNNNIILIPNKLNHFTNMKRIIPLNNMRNNNKNIYNTNYKFYSNTNSSMSNNFTNLSSLNSSHKMSNNYAKTSQNTIKTFEYIPISIRNNNSPKVNNNNNNYYQNLKKKLLFDKNIKQINLDNLKLKKLTKNYSYDSIKNKNKIINVNNHNSLSNINQIFKNNQRIFKVIPQNNGFILNNINQLRIRHYSPNNNINHNNKFKNLFSQQDKQFINIRKNVRNNSETNIKKALNYNNSNINFTENLAISSRSPKNINNLNSQKFNFFGSKCYNFIKI